MAQLVEVLDEELYVLLGRLHRYLVELVAVRLLGKRLVLISCGSSAKSTLPPTFLLAPVLLAIVLLARGAVHGVGPQEAAPGRLDV